MLLVKYSIFAIISILVNLFFQWLSFFLYKGFASLYLAMFIGTLTGLIIKYILDKKWIFYYASKSKKEDAKNFILYSFMGVFTTIIFWATEMIFYYLISNPNSKYIGAIVGLTIGYTIKYFLDRKYVFIQKKR